MEKCILVQKNSVGRVKYITLTLNKDTLDRVWGLIDGKSQETSNTYGYINKGKANQLNPEQSARSDYERVIKNKTKEGYIVTEALDELPDLDSNTIDFDNLPVEFCCSKPNTKINDKKLNALIKKGNVRFNLKYNGLCHYILITSTNNVKIYTRRVDDHTVKYPDLVNSIRKQNFPPNTLLIGELVVDPIYDIPHMVGFKLISQIAKANTVKGKPKEDLTKSNNYQKEHKVRCAVFNVLYYDGVDVWKKNCKYTIENYINKLPLIMEDSAIFQPMTLNFNSAEEARGYTKKHVKMYEGLVVWDLDQPVEISFNGKPKRRACYKIKASRDDDVVAVGYLEGTGDHQGLIGSLLIGKYNKDGEFIDLGRVGSGLKDDECIPDNWEFPCVVEIEYDQRFPTGKYQFPRFTKVHEDKIPTDIIVDGDGL